MAATDRIFKELLHRFFPDFMRLFFPEEATYLDFSTATWLEQELISNFPDQKLRVSDVVVELGTVKGEEQVVLVHIEVEASRKESLPARMFEYYSLLRALRQKPVLPLACVLIPRSGGLQWQTYREHLFNHTLVEFHYGQVGLPDLDSAPYLASGQPVAAALAALMRPGEQAVAEVKLAALQIVIGSALTDGDKLFLINVVETYLPRHQVPAAGERVMEALTDVEMTWLEKAHQEGLEQGLERGLEKGLEEGLLVGQRDLLAQLLEAKFGPLPDWVTQRLAALKSRELIEALSKQLLVAVTLEEIQWPAGIGDE